MTFIQKSVEQDADATPGIELDSAYRYIELLTGSQDTPITFQTFDQDSDRKSSKLNRISHGSLGENADELQRLNRSGAGVFVMVNEGNLQGRAAKDVTGVRAVFADFDDPERNPLDQIERGRLDPDWIVESSPGKYHAYRRVSGLAPDPVLFAGVQRLLADHLGSDPVVIDLPRILRLPGFVHCKVKKGVASTPFVARIHEARSEGRVTAFSDLLTEFGWTEDQAREAGGKSSRKTSDKAHPKQPRAAVAVTGDPFTVQLHDGEGRNGHLLKLAGICAVQGLDTDTTLVKVRDWNENNVEPIDDAILVEACTRIVAKEAAKKRSFEQTELGFAQWLAAVHGDDFRYVADLGRWLWWDGRTWCFDTGGAKLQEAGKALARSILSLASAEPDDARRAALKKWNIRMETAKAIGSAIKLAQSDETFLIHAHQLDQHHFKLAVDNGLLDLKTGSVRAPDREALITKRAFVTFDQSATCPRWERFVAEITCGNVELAAHLQRIAGYCLTGVTREHSMLMFVGHGSNGKSVFLNTLMSILGMYAIRLPASALMVKRGESVPNDIALLQGARLAVTSELSAGMQLDEAKLKDLTSDDAITARHLYGNFFSFTPSHKLLMATNHLPIVSNTDNGIWRRIQVARFQATYDETNRDLGLQAKLLSESSGILNWLIEGCRQWQAEGIRTPQAIRDWTGEFRESLDVVGQFIDEACVRADDLNDSEAFRVGGHVLFQAYDNYAKANGLPRMGNRASEAISSREAGIGLLSGVACPLDLGTGGADPEDWC